jgi:hypothetical protein
MDFRTCGRWFYGNLNDFDLPAAGNQLIPIVSLNGTQIA